MQSMTLEQLRAAASAGGVVDVALKGQGSGFFVEIAIRSGQGAYQWLAGEIQEAIDDPSPSLPHDEVMARMDGRIQQHKTA